MTAYDCSHYTDGTGSCDKDVLTGQVEFECSMYCIAQSIEASDSVQWDTVDYPDDVFSRDDDILSKATIPVHSDTHRIFAQMLPPSHAVTAGLADDMPLAGYNISNFILGDTAAKFNYLADKLMTYDLRRLNGALTPLVPVEM